MTLLKPCAGMVLTVAEFIDLPDTWDRRKRQLYAAAGVPDYWIFDPVNDDVALLELRDGEYVQRARLTAVDALITARLAGRAIPLVDVFRYRRRAA